MSGQSTHHFQTADNIAAHENINVYAYTSYENMQQHTHDFIELVYILSGTGRHSVNDTWYTVCSGDLLFITPHQTHAFCVDGAMGMVNCLIAPAFLHEENMFSENALELLSLALCDDLHTGLAEPVPMLRFRGAERLELKRLINSMLQEFSAKQAGYKSALRGYLLVVLSKIFRHMQTSGSNELLQQVDVLLPDILQYIESHFAQKITLAQLAQRCYYSPSYLSHLFKEYCGVTLTEFLRDKRMQKAEDLLLASNLSIEDICHKAGYQDRNQFYKHFRQHTGMSPGKYRSAAKGTK